MAATAVLGEEGDERARAFNIDGIEDAPVDPPRPQQPGALEMRQVVRERRRRDCEPVRNLAGGEPARTLGDHQPEHRKPVLLRQRGKGFNSASNFHYSNIVEASNEVNRRRSSCGSLPRRFGSFLQWVTERTRYRGSGLRAGGADGEGRANQVIDSR